MIRAVVLSLLLQADAPLPAAYESEVSAEVRAVLAQVDDAASAAQIARLEALAEHGDDSALELLGEMFSRGLFGLAPDAPRACAYFERLGERRPDGLHNRATCRYDGRAMAQDWPEARRLYRLAADGGWRQALCAYGNMLVRGEGGPADPAEGVRLCRMAAAAGNRDAQTDYGGYLLMGIGSDRDPVGARFVLEQAAAQRQANAAFLLAQIHMKGDGVDASPAEAQRWFAKAWEWGRADAAFETARQLMRQGYRTDAAGEISISPALLKEAIGWLRLARERDPDASRRRDADRLIPDLERLIAAASTDR